MTYIAFEGIDGSGKTKQLELLEEELKRRGFSVLVTKEFGSPHDDACLKLREFALNSSYKFDELAGQFMFAACSSQHSERVLDRYQEFDYILSDRSIESNLAYGPPALAQAYSSQYTLDELREVIHKLFFLDSRRIHPDKVLYLNVDPETTWARLNVREKEQFDGGTDRIEAKGLEFQKSVRSEYARRVEENGNYIVIDCNEASIEETHKMIIESL